LVGLLVSAITLGVSITAVQRLGFFLQAPAAAPVPADLIVTLGGDGGARVLKAAELYLGGYAPRVLLTGVEGGHDRVRRHYLSWRARYLTDNGVPRAALMFDEASKSSWDEGVNTLELMRRQGWTRVLIVSDPPHLRRLHWVWHRLSAPAGIEYRLVASEPAWWDTAHWWGNEQSSQFVLSELGKMAYYRFVHG
jgi:uncharacterized SAM-binding protein YcdF (DUF218 family)